MALNNYTLGRGELWFDRFDDTFDRGERYLGNSPEFNLSVDVETIEHFNADRGFKDKDESATLSSNWNGNFTTDNVNTANLALFFSGRGRTLTLGAVADGEDTFHRVARGLAYQIGASDTNPSGLRKLTSVVMKKGVTTLVENTDYTVDLVMGRVTLLSTGSTVLTGDTITAEYVAPAQTRVQIISGRESVSGSLRYIAFNSLGGQFDYFMPYVKLSAAGDFELKGDDWQKISFNVEVLRMDNKESVYVDGRALT